MKKYIGILLSTIITIGSVSNAFAMSNNYETESLSNSESNIVIDANVVNDLVPDMNITLELDEETLNQQDKEFEQLLDDLLELKIKKHQLEKYSTMSKSKLSEDTIFENLDEDENTVQDEITVIYEKMEELGAHKLSNKEAKIFLNQQNTKASLNSTPNVPDDTKKYEYWSKSTYATVGGKKYPVFHIFAQPNTNMSRNLLVNEQNPEEVDSASFSASTKNKAIDIIFKELVDDLITKRLPYKDYLPYDLLFQNDYSNNTNYRVLIGGAAYTTCDFIYVAYPNTSTYSQVISSAKAKGSIEVTYRTINSYSKTGTIDFTSTGEYYNTEGTERAAKLYSQGSMSIHYYPLDDVKGKVNNKSSFSLALKSVSSVSSL